VVYPKLGDTQALPLCSEGNEGRISVGYYGSEADRRMIGDLGLDRKGMHVNGMNGFEDDQDVCTR
jgi:hypothetical protein